MDTAYERKDGAYPPGVTGKMIDELEGDGNCCENCCNYFNGTCDIAERPFTAEQIEAMSDEEYAGLVERDPDDYCDKWDSKDSESLICEEIQAMRDWREMDG